MAFNLNETYFSEKFDIWLRNRQKIAQVEDFSHFLDCALLVFLDFAHNDRWLWCLVVFLQFGSPANAYENIIEKKYAQCVQLWAYYHIACKRLHEQIDCYL